MQVMAGDLGGTKTIVQMAEVDPDGAQRVLYQRTYQSNDYPQLLPLLQDFLARAHSGAPQGACFGVPGPVHGARAKTTNLPWSIDARALERALGIPRVHLINDFQAAGYGIEALAPGDLVTLQAGETQPGAPRALLGAGTGLGEALLVRRGERYQVLASEGGHADFAPTDELQMALLAHLLARFGQVSYERVVSGSGLVAIYEFLCTRAGVATVFDGAARISGAALAGDDPTAVQALDLFVRVYGAQAGNLALTVLATGGVYVAGGIAPKIIDKLRDGAFMEAFCNKGRMRALAETMPVHVITNPEVGLLGAAVVAHRGVPGS